MIKIFSIPLVSTSKYGFRLSLVDIVMIVFTIMITCVFPPDFQHPMNMENLFHYLIPYVVFNFFLFCNVFRVRTRYELCWLSSATINILLLLMYYQNIVVFFITQSIFTLIAIVFEIRSEKYHGIFCKNKA